MCGKTKKSELEKRELGNGRAERYFLRHERDLGHISLPFAYRS